MLFSFFWISKSSFFGGRDVDRLLREWLRERDVSRRLRLRLRDFPLRFLAPAPPPLAGFFLRSAPPLRLRLDEDRDDDELCDRRERERDLRVLRSFDLDLDLDLERERLVLAFFLLAERDLDRERDVERLRLRRFDPGAGFLPSAMFINFDCSFEMEPLSVGFSLGGAFFALGGLRERFRPLSRGRTSRSRLSLGERLRFLDRSVDLLADRERRRSRDDFRSREERLSRERRRDRERSRDGLRRDRSRSECSSGLRWCRCSAAESFTGFSGDFLALDELRSVDAPFSATATATVAFGSSFGSGLSLGTSASMKSSIIFSSSSRYSSGSGLYMARFSFLNFL